MSSLAWLSSWAERRRRRLTRPRPTSVLTLALLTACHPNQESPIERAEFGVFFGGQVQERTEIPYELDASRQSMGFVVKLSHPMTQPTPLNWEISKPAPNARMADPVNRRVELFTGVLPPGQAVVSKVVKFEPGDGLGMWNIRVTLGRFLALDRPFQVYDPASRGPVRRRKPAPPSDAGL